MGEPAFQHLLHFQNDIDELATERQHRMAEVKREKGEKVVPASDLVRFLSPAVDKGDKRLNSNVSSSDPGAASCFGIVELKIGRGLKRPGPSRSDFSQETDISSDCAQW